MNEERLSECCGAPPDGRFSVENRLGVCNDCKEHAEFYTEEELNALDEMERDLREMYKKGKSWKS